MTDTCIIVIPIHKTAISGNELLSLAQCFKVLKNYPIVFIGTESLDTTFYENFCKLNDIKFKIERFKDKYFQSVASYSNLLLDANFYKRFNYEYMLIYQLDAWIFEDKLQEWIQKGYDYVGAPWFEGFQNAKPDSKMLEIAGNGGLSLRKIPSCIKVLSSAFGFKHVLNWKDIFKFYGKNRMISNILSLPEFLWKRFGLANINFLLSKSGRFQEDFYFAQFAPRIDKKFKVAQPKEAMLFSFEANPSKLYELTNQTLPFGCHAWEKYEYDFWSRFISNQKRTIKQ